jgi:hypothetical protein
MGNDKSVLGSLWGMLPEAVRNNAVTDKYARLSDLAHRASERAEQEFPNDERDASKKNAFRHSLGTGMLAEELGGGMLGAGLAKMAGYGWEGLSIPDYFGNPQKRTDALHDFTANDIGAKAATYLKGEELVRHLKNMANNATYGEPRGFFEPSQGKMTYSEQPARWQKEVASN